MKSDKINKNIIKALLISAVCSGLIAHQIDAVAKQENETSEALPEELDEHLNSGNHDNKINPPKFVNQIKLEPEPPRSNDPVQGSCKLRNQCRSEDPRK
jgi:hypothetical protein